MQIMKITISLDDMEVLSFDILVVFLITIAYFFYLAICFLNNIDSKDQNNQSRNQSELDDEEEEEDCEMKLNYENDNNESIIEKENISHGSTPKAVQTENEMKSLKIERMEKKNTQKQVQQKKEEDWMVIRKGKKVKKQN